MECRADFTFLLWRRADHVPVSLYQAWSQPSVSLSRSSTTRCGYIEVSQVPYLEGNRPRAVASLRHLVRPACGAQTLLDEHAECGMSVLHLPFGTLSRGTAPPATAPAPAADAGVAPALPTAPLPVTLLITLVKGTTVQRANQGVNQTLPTNRTGRSAFVTAYAVANSNTTRTPPCKSSPRPPPSASSSSATVIHPLFLSHFPNLRVPSST